MLNRLRRQRWMWAFALLALSFKLVAGTVCLNDPVVGQHAVATQVPAATAVMAAAPSDGAACLLGEGSGCHCACPETLPVPATLDVPFGPAVSHFVFAAPAYVFAPAYAGSPLRPPIA